MKISKLIQQLQIMLDIHGDISVEARNPAGDYDLVESVEIFKYRHNGKTVVFLTTDIDSHIEN